MHSFSSKCLSKINLGLKVGLKSKKTKLHLVEGVFARCTLSDDIDIDLSDEFQTFGDRDEYKTTSTGIDGIQVSLKVGIGGELERQLKTLHSFEKTLDDLASLNNIIFKTLDVFYRRVKSLQNKPRSILLTINKNIPLEAGLGGGSANAAECLKILCKHHGITDKELLRDLSFQIGNDVYPCLYNEPLYFNAFEVISAKSTPLNIDCVLVKPPYGSSTGEAFKLLDRPFFEDTPDDVNLSSGKITNQYSLEELEAFLEDVRAMKAVLQNDFLKPVTSELPFLSSIPGTLNESGAQISSMSGSGTSFFGIYKSSEIADQAFCLLRSSLGDDWFISREKISV